MKNMEPNEIIDQPLLTIKEVTQKLKISRQLLWKLTTDKDVRVVRIGSSVRYPQSELHKLLEQD